MDGDDIRSRLEAAGQRFASADRERDEAMAALAELVNVADRELSNRSEIARLAQISRQTLYALLKEKS